MKKVKNPEAEPLESAIQESDIEKAQYLLKQATDIKLRRTAEKLSAILEEEGTYLYVDLELVGNKINSFIRLGVK